MDYFRAAPGKPCSLDYETFEFLMVAKDSCTPPLTKKQIQPFINIFVSNYDGFKTYLFGKPKTVIDDYDDDPELLSD